MRFTGFVAVLHRHAKAFSDCIIKFVILVFFFLKNPPSSASFSLIFCLFKQTIQILQKNVKNFRPVSRARDSNSWPSDFKSPPLFTIPGHQSYFTFRYCIIYFGDECYYLLEQMLLPATYTTFYLLPSTLEQWLTE